jgi:G protein beta subunit-like protein
MTLQISIRAYVILDGRSVRSTFVTMSMEGTNFLLAASYSLSIAAYDIATGSAHSDFEIQNSQANRLVTRPRESVFFAAGYSYVLLYDMQKKVRKPTQSFVAHEGNVTDLDLSPTLIVTSGDDKTLKTWDRRTYQAGVIVRTTSANNSVQILSSQHILVSGNESGFVELHDLRNQQLLSSVKISGKPVRSVALAPDGRRVIAAAQDGKLFCYTCDDGILTELYHTQASNDIQLRTVISPDGRSFAATAANNTAKIWNLENGDLKQSLVASDERVWIWDAAFTQDSAKLCTGGSDGVCRMFDCENGRMELSFPPAEKCVSCIAILSLG